MRPTVCPRQTRVQPACVLPKAGACVDTPRVSLMSTARVPPGKLWLELGTRGQPRRAGGWTPGEGVLSLGLSRSGCTFLVLPTFRPPLRQHTLALVTPSPRPPPLKRPPATGSLRTPLLASQGLPSLRNRGQSRHEKWPCCHNSVHGTCRWETTSPGERFPDRNQCPLQS